MPRLVLWTVMQMDENAMGHLAPDCSSWGVPSRGTSWRTYVNFAGNIFLPWVRGANLQVSRFLSLSCLTTMDMYWPFQTVKTRNLRLVLVLLLMMSRHLVWVLEQPRNSLLFRHRRFEWFINTVAFVP